VLAQATLDVDKMTCKQVIFAKKFSYAEELSLARIIADPQGLGEHSGKA
jgi:hypothetical protein